MVYALPASLIAIGALGLSVKPWRLVCHVVQPPPHQILQGGRVSIIVEVATHHNLCPCRQCADGLHQSFRHQQTVRSGGLLATIAAGGMHYKDVQGVPSPRLALHIKNVACGAHVFQRLYLQAVVAQRSERHGLVHQGHVNAAHIRRLRHQELIAGLSQQGTPRQVVETRVVLHLHQRHQVRQAVVHTRQQFLGNVVLLAPIARRCPMTQRSRTPLGILLQSIVLTVKQILAVQLHERQP